MRHNSTSIINNNSSSSNILTMVITSSINRWGWRIEGLLQAGKESPGLHPWLADRGQGAGLLCHCPPHTSQMGLGLLEAWMKLGEAAAVTQLLTTDN